MFFEAQVPIEIRKQAASKWRDAYFVKILNEQPQSKAERALLVLVLNSKTSDYLAEHDPMSLKYAQEALDGKSWQDFQDKVMP